MALVLVAVWFLLGLVVVSRSHAREAGRLPHHPTVAVVFVAGSVGGSLVWKATIERLLAPVAAGIGIGVCG